MEDLRKIIQALVNSNAAAGMTVAQLEKDFRSLEGHSIPYQEYGFQSLDAMLRTMSNSVRISGYGQAALVQPITTEKNQHIRTMIEKSKKDRKKSSFRPHVTKTSSSRYGGPPSFFSSAYSPSYNANRNHTPDRRIDDGDTFARRNDFMLANSSDECDEAFEEFMESLVSNFSNINVGQQPQPSIKHGPPTSYNSYCRNNSLSLGTQKPSSDCNNNKRAQSGATGQTYSSSTAESKVTRGHITPENTTTKKETVVTENGKRTQSKAYPQSLSAATGVQSKVSNRCLQLDKTTENIAHTEHSTMPLNATTINEKIMETNLPADLKPDAIVKAIATAVLNPAHLFVHLKEHTDVLLHLAPKIDSLYNAQANAPEWVIPEETAKVGRYCVAKYKGRWLRALIVGTEPNHQCVLLHYVDYGYVRYVALSELRYMTPELVAIPCQVLRIALAHLNPSDGRWTDACVQHVANAVRGRVFYMRIVNVHKKDNALDVIFGDWVSDLREPNDKSFNRQLAMRSDIVYSEK